VELDNMQANNILDAVFSWSKKQDFRGHNKHDGLNSPILRLLLGWAKWPRIIAIQTVMRSPINIRSLLGVPKTTNPKGLALFVLGLLDRFQTEGKQCHLDEAVLLLEKLYSVQSPGKHSGACWGYPYPWQDLGFFAPSHTPNAVVTCFVCEAFLKAYRVSGNQRYLEVVGEAIEFFTQDLKVLLDEPDKLCLAYMPLPMSMRVMDVSILIGAVIGQYAALSGQHENLETARRLISYVAGCQTDYGAWYYTDPPGDSLIRHDNYHTGFILDALWRYMEAVNDWQWRGLYEKGLRFYAEELFNNDGSPRWMSDKDFPHDVHGAAQGLVTFSKATDNGYPHSQLLERIYEWSLATLYNGSGRFYYQHCPWGIKRFTLLRWCNAWMFRGLAAYNLIQGGGKKNDR